MPVEACFPSPIYYTQVDNLDIIQKDFERAFLDLKNNKIFQQRPGWDSTSQFLSDPKFEKSLIDDYNLVAFKNELRKHVLEFVKTIEAFPYEIPNFEIPHSWMTLTVKGQSSHLHAHGSADISGAYYYKTNEQDGEIFFKSPCRLLMDRSIVFTNESQKKVFYKPKIGQLLLFPGYLEHAVTQNTTDSERVSISFNIYFDRY